MTKLLRQKKPSSLSCSFRTLGLVSVLSVLLLHCTYLQHLKIWDSYLIFDSFWLATVISLFVLLLCFAPCSTFVLRRLRLSLFVLCFVLMVAWWWFVLRFATVNCLFLGLWLQIALAIVIGLSFATLVGWLAIFIRFSCCDANLPVLTSRIVVCLLLRDAYTLGWFDCLLVDMQCARDSWLTKYINQGNWPNEPVLIFYKKFK